MRMPVMDVGIMRMAMHQPPMRVRVGVGLARGIARSMRVMMMGVVNVAVFVR